MFFRKVEPHGHLVGTEKLLLTLLRGELEREVLTSIRPRWRQQTPFDRIQIHSERRVYHGSRIGRRRHESLMSKAGRHLESN